MRLLSLAIFLCLALCFGGCSSATKIEPETDSNITLSVIEQKDHPLLKDEGVPPGAKGYAPLATDVPENQTFQFVMHGLKGDVHLGEFRMQQGEFAMLDKEPMPFSKLFLGIGNYLRGEPFEYRLVTKSGKIAAAATIVPDPIEVTAKDGAKIYAQILDPKAEMFEIRGAGFMPNETINVSSISCDESISGTFTTYKNGKFYMPFGAAVKGKKGGKVQLTFARHDETLKLEFDWGKDAFKKPASSQGLTGGDLK